MFFLFFVILLYRLKPLDIQFMKQLHNKVNIVPVLAKADTLTKQEVAKLKRKVSITSHHIISWLLTEKCSQTKLCVMLIWFLMRLDTNLTVK